jgi:hypothetical protein
LDLVCHWLAVDWVSHIGVLDLEGAVVLVRGVITTRFFDDRLLHIVTGTKRVEIGSTHWKGFIIYQAIIITIDHGIDTQAENMLVMNRKNTGVHDRSKWYFHTFVNGLGAENSGGSDFVIDFSGLVENEGKYVLVI